MGMGFVVVLPRKVAGIAAAMMGGKIVGEIVEEGIRVSGLGNKMNTFF